MARFWNVLDFPAYMKPLPLCRAVLFGTILAAWACTSSAQPKKIGSQPSWRKAKADDASESVAKGGDPAVGNSESKRAAEPKAIVLAPSSTATRAYNDPALEPPPSAPLEDAIVDTVNAFCNQNGIDVPRPDGRLYKAAAEVASIMPDDGLLSYPVLEFALHHHGIIEPSPHVVPVSGSLEDPQEIVDQLAERLPPILAREKVNRIGIGKARGQGPVDDTLVVLLQASHVKTKPIPKQVPRGGRFSLEGEVLGDYLQPEVFVTTDDGFVVRQDLRIRKKTKFRTAISCKGRRGRQQVEITAANAAGSTVLANFPVYCGDAVPTRIEVDRSEVDANVATEEQAQELMLKLVNRDRKKHGLPPLQHTPKLTEIARAHSIDMRDSGFVGHVSPNTGSAEDRVKKANYRTAMVLENIARAYGVVEAEAGLMNSPGHRANLLSDMATHIGIGVVFKESRSEGRVMFVTQLFSRVPPPIDPDEARKTLQAKIAQAVPQVRADPTLSAVAQAYATNVVIPGLSKKAAESWRNANFDRLRRPFARIGTAEITVIDLDSLDPKKAFRDKWVTHYGLGIAQGYHEEFGEGAIYIVLMMAQAR